MKKHDSIVPDLSEIVGAEKQRQQLHISGINMLNECGTRFEFRYIMGLKRRPNGFLITGISTDKAVGADLTNKIDKGELLSAEEVKTVAADSVVRLSKEMDIEAVDDDMQPCPKEKVIDDAKDKAVRLVERHHESVAPSIAASFVNKKFSISLDKFMRTRAKMTREDARELFDRGNRYASRVLEDQATKLNSAAREGWDFVGEWDIGEEFVDPETLHSFKDRLTIRDTKTSKKSPTESAADDSEQLTGYAVAAETVYGKLPEKLVLDYLVDLKGGVKYVPRETTRNADDEMVFFNRLANAVHAIKSGIFVPTKPDDWRCSQKWCGYFDICPYAKRPKLVQIGSAASA